MIRLWLCALTLIALVSLDGSSHAAQKKKELKGTFFTFLMDEKWSITFDGKSKFIVKKKNELMVEGSYKIRKEEIEFTDKKGPIAAVKEKAGKYEWNLDGKKLTFKKIEDDVKGRELGLTSSAWTAEK